MAEKVDRQKKPRFRPKKQRKSLRVFLREFRSEFKKVVWSTPKQIVNNTLVTIIMVTIVGAFIWILDFILTNIIRLIYG